MATYLITGANRGIGTEYCRQLQARGDAVIAACRTASPELEALGVRIETEVDISSDAAIAGLVERLDGLPLDGLIHNASILERTSLDALDLESIRRQFEVNAVGPLRLTAALLGQLHDIKANPDDQPHGLDRRQQLRRLLWLPDVEGGAMHGRQIAIN